MNFKPRDGKVICSSVSCEFDRFLICWLPDLMLFKALFLFDFSPLDSFAAFNNFAISSVSFPFFPYF